MRSFAQPNLKDYIIILPAVENNQEHYIDKQEDLSSMLKMIILRSQDSRGKSHTELQASSKTKLAEPGSYF